jgi:hypothetical protein
MKLTSRIWSTLALLLISLGAVPPANAVGLLGFGPPPATFINSVGAVVTVPGLPAWFQDQNGVTVQPCLDAVPCALVARALNPLSVPPVTIAFDPLQPLVYPTNFPDEAFYFAATATFPVGPNTAQFVVTQEFVFLDNPDPLIGKPTFPGALVAVPAPFQRMRFDYVFNGFNPTNVPGLVLGTPPAAALVGLFKLTTPWGDTTFNLQDALTNTKTTNTKCEIVGVLHDTHCTFTRDTFFSAVPPAFVPDFTSALAGAILPTDFGGAAMSTFLQDPAAAPGFVGSAAAAPLSFTGAPAGRANLFSVTDPMGNTGSTTTLLSLTGKKFGIEVQPGSNFNFGAVTIQAPPAPSAARTVTVTNFTGNPILFPALAVTGADAADFAITSPSSVAVAGVGGCSGATLAAAASCSFDVTFNPLAGLTAARSATISVAPTSAPQLTNPPPVTINLSGTAQYPLTVAVATTNTLSGTITANNGNGTLTSTPPGLNCSNVAAVAAAGTAATVNCTASFDVGATVNLTPAATQSPLSLFDGWTGLCSGTGACAVTMDAVTAAVTAPAVTASFIDSHIINTSASPAAGGTITPTQTVKHGATPTVVITPTSTLTPRVSYRIVSLTDNAAPAAFTPVGTNSSSYQLLPVVKDHTVTANFIRTFLLTPVAAAGGAVKNSSDGITPATEISVDSGAAKTFAILPDAGYRIGSVLVDGAAQVIPVAAKTFDVPFTAVAGDHTIIPTFVKIWNVVSAVAGNGSVDISGVLSVDDGTTPGYTFTPSSKKFQVGRILVDNAPQTFTKPATISGGVSFSLPPVKTDKSVSATFVPSGDLDENGTVDVADALKAMKIFINLLAPDPTDLEAMKIGPLDTSGVPTGGTGAPDLNDIILILKKAVGIVKW